MVSRLETFGVWSRKKILLEVRKDDFRNSGNNDISWDRFFIFQSKAAKDCVKCTYGKGEKIHQSFENLTWPAGKERRTAERNKNKIFGEIGSGPPTAEKELPERNVSAVICVLKFIQCQN